MANVTDGRAARGVPIVVIGFGLLYPTLLPYLDDIPLIGTLLPGVPGQS